MKIGITERGDGGLQFDKVRDALAVHRVNGAITVTKRPDLLMYDHNWPLPTNLIIHCTITGLRQFGLEPGLDHCQPEGPITQQDTMLFDYAQLVKYLGQERVVLRIDPIITFGKYLDAALIIAAQANSTALRVRISFLDMYYHVKARLQARFPDIVRYYNGSMHAPLADRERARELIGKAAACEPEVCGEPDMACSGCISQRDLQALKLTMPTSCPIGNQRKTCHCLAMKTELLTEKKPCPNGCLYCYWKDNSK